MKLFPMHLNLSISGYRRVLVIACVLVSVMPWRMACADDETALDKVRSHFAALEHSGRIKIHQMETPTFSPGFPESGVKVIAEFTYHDMRDVEKRAMGKFLIPKDVADGSASGCGLVYGAGYEMPNHRAAQYFQRGMAVVTPLKNQSNPLSRSSNLDVALLHIARGLPFVDDARVIITGSSAGGFTTLMLSAETFPLAAAIPFCPPLNWGYNAEYFLANRPLILSAKNEDGQSAMPIINILAPFMDRFVDTYPEDTNSEIYLHHSPIGQVRYITCPVYAQFSTGDILVPIDQLGRQFSAVFDPDRFPTGYTFSPEKLMNSDAGRTRLLDVLSPDQYTLIMTRPPADATPQYGLPDKPSTASMQMPYSPDRQWNIVVVDEGPIDPRSNHLLHLFIMHLDGYLDNVLNETTIDPAQLTRTKLKQLMDRYTGREWMSPGIRHLDAPFAERADVLRGLKTYVNASPACAARFVELYLALPESYQHLDVDMESATPQSVGRVLSDLGSRE